MPDQQPDKIPERTETHIPSGSDSSVQSNIDETSPQSAKRSSTSEQDFSIDGGIPFGPPANEGEVGTFGRYRVLKPLGQGGMGAVYLAFDQRLSRKIALKVMLPVAAKNAMARDRFVREARAAGQINDDHVVAIYEADEYQGTPFIALQYLEGSPLDLYLKKKGNVSIDQAIRIGIETSRGLEAAHKLGLIHRDIKPANLWLEAPKGRVKILDFGLARQANEDVHITQSGAILGTPAYMSPEQARAEKIDHRTDLFSLGTVLYRLTTGEMPFKGSTTMSVLTSLAVDEPVDVRKLNPNIPDSLATIIHQLLAKNPDARPKSAAEVAKRLEAIQRGEKTAVQTSTRQVEYVPVAVSVIAEDVWAGIEDEITAPETVVTAKKKSNVASPPKSSNKWMVYASVFVLGGVVVLGGVMSLANKFGKEGAAVVESKGRETAKVEGNGKSSTSDKAKNAENPKLDPPAPLPPWTPPKLIKVGDSPYDKLDPKSIPKEERFDWQPKELVAVLGTHVRKHWGFVHSVAISPDGKLAASTAETWNDRLVIWDLETLTPKWTDPLVKSVYGSSLVFSPDSRRLFVLQYSEIFEFDLSGPAPKRTRHQLPAPQSAFVDPTLQICENGATLVVSHHRPDFVCIDITSGKPVIKTVKEIASARWLSVSSEKNLVVFRDKDGKSKRATIKNADLTNIVDLELGTEFEASPFSLSLREDGKIASGWEKESLAIWGIESALPKKSYSFEFGIPISTGSKITMSEDGKWISLFQGMTPSLFRFDGQKIIKVANLDDVAAEIAYSIPQFSKDSKRVVVCNGHGCIRVWDVSGAEPKEIVPFDSRGSYDISKFRWPSINPRGGQLMLPLIINRALMNYGGNVLWDFAGQSLKKSPGPDEKAEHDAKLYPIANNRWISLPTSAKKPMQCYEFKEDKWVTTCEPFGDSLTHVANVSGDGKWLFQISKSNSGEFLLNGWDVGGVKPIKMWSKPISAKLDQRLNSAIFSSWDGSQVLVHHNDPVFVGIYRNNGSNAELTSTIPGNTELDFVITAISPDGTTIASTRSNPFYITLDDVSSGKPKYLNSTSGDLELLGRINWLSFSPDGKYLAYATKSRVGVMNVSTLKSVYQWTSPGQIDWVDWAPDGRHIVTHNGNKTVYVLRLGDIVANADRIAAEYVISIGGKVNVAIDDKFIETEISRIEDLPKVPFQLNVINLYGNTKLDDDGMALFGDCQHLRIVHFSSPLVTDTGLAHLKNKPKLTGLAIRMPLITDQGLANFNGIKNLTLLRLDGTKVTDVGLANFRNCGKLNDLGLMNTAITDAGCFHFRNCDALLNLHMGGTNVTDKGFDHFKNNKRLMEMFVSKTKITAAKVEEFHKMAPECRIVWDGGEKLPKSLEGKKD